MTDEARALRRVVAAHRRVDAAEQRVPQARLELRDAIASAVEAGHSNAAIGRAIGLTRARISQILLAPQSQPPAGGA